MRKPASARATYIGLAIASSRRIMRHSKLLPILAILPLFVACSAPASDESSDTSSESLVGGWTKVLTCWQGDSRVVVDVDSGERRNVQVVVSGGAAHWLASNYNISTTPILNAKGEVIGSGRVNRGIFNPWDLDTAELNIPYATLEAKRENGGLRVTMWVVADSWRSYCDEDGQFEGECLEGHWHDFSHRGDLANWYFPSCDN
jgi:hypothetical protein